MLAALSLITILCLLGGGLLLRSLLVAEDLLEVIMGQRAFGWSHGLVLRVSAASQSSSLHGHVAYAGPLLCRLFGGCLLLALVIFTIFAATLVI